MAKDVSSSIDKDTGIVLVIALRPTSFLIFRVLGFLQIAVSIKAREIHFKRGQSEELR